MYGAIGKGMRNTHAKYESPILREESFKQTKSVTDGQMDDVQSDP